MPVTSPDMLGLCCEITDAVQFLAPRGWTRVDVELDNRGGQIRVVRLDAKLDAKPPPTPELGMDPAGRLGGMSAAFTDLLHQLHHDGVEWAGTRASLSRSGADQVVLTLSNPDGRPASAVSIPREFLDALFVSDAFLSAIAEVDERLVAMQRATAERLSTMTNWKYGQPERKATFERVGQPPLEIAAQIIGTWSSDEEAWLWGWANTSIEPGCTDLIEKAIDPDARAPGFAALWREKYPCEEAFAAKVALFAAFKAGATGVYRGRIGNATAYLALMG